MASNYEKIRRDNERRYGTDIGRIGPMLLAERYDERTHFIFELLQNAEDALAKRGNPNGRRSIRFELRKNELRVSHFGKLFDEADVRGICGIAESTKDLTDIGRFGIGFKSVYAFTDRPEIHSGTEDFAVESYVWPVAVPPIGRKPDETVILLPLRDIKDHEIILSGLRRLGPGALLFLRQIEEIEWTAESGPSGLYLRSESDIEAESVRRITIIGQEEEKPEIEQTWVVFSRPVTTDQGNSAGYVEIAFAVRKEGDANHETVIRVPSSPLVVFFPTILETHLGFLVQGPYRTTPSRDNVPRSDPWNQHLVRETAILLVEALRWLRDHGLLDTAALRCLPLDPAKFGKGTMFAPLFTYVKHALSFEPLLPRFDGGHVAATNARLARTQELRELFDPNQLAALFGHRGELFWVSGDITHDRTPELRQYLMCELGITEVTPETVIPKLDKKFLEAQPDSWITRLYEFLGGQSTLRRRLNDIPLVRLEDGMHVAPHVNGRPQAYLPSKTKTGFPTVRSAVCATKAAREFLGSLGLTEPDPVDDVIWNVLPKYRADKVDFSDADYEADIRRILTAFATDSKGQRDKLIAALNEAAFVMSVDAGDGSKHMSKPGDVYLATERLKELFAGVVGVMLVDDSYPFLKGEDVRKLLEACGAVRYLRPVPDTTLSWEERSKFRVQAGHADTSGQNDRVNDWNLLGLEALLEVFPNLSTEERRTKARLLWEELANLEERRGKSIFDGEYTWTHYGSYRVPLDAAFIRQLNRTAWVPDQNGELQKPEVVLFDSLEWEPNSFLQSKIRFKPPIIEQLAREAGIEPGLLDLLKKCGITREAQLRELLGVEVESSDGHRPADVNAALKELAITEAPTPAVADPAATNPVPTGDGGGSAGRWSGTGSGGDRMPGGGGHTGPRFAGAGSSEGRRTLGNAGGRLFISYVAARPGDEEPDPDGLDHPARMALEEKAIELILSREPAWRRTPTHNPGFDLYQGNDQEGATQWCEVKAMTGRLADRPVGLSHIQFEWARAHGEAYWLYVVERAGTDEARIVRIQNPAGKARTFTFDHGWLNVAKVDSDSGERKG